MRARLVWIGVVGLALAGCQPMPHPFEPGAKGYNPLLDLKESKGVVVLPVAGVPPVFSERLSAALAGALRDAEIPAAVDVGNRGSFVITGTVKRRDADAPDPLLEIEWDVADAGGRGLGTVALHERVPAEALDPQGVGPPPGVLAALAKRSLTKVLPLVRDDMPGEAPNAIAVGAIDGAPGDGAVSLKRAVEFVLRQSDIPMAAADQPNALTLLASVEMGRPADGRQSVAIRWVLLLPDGREIGNVSQQNAVPAGSLDRNWGETALLVAEAAYDGIIALYQKVPDVIAQ